MATNHYDYFISWSRDSKDFAFLLRESIEKLELGKVFLSDIDIKGGDEWFQGIIDALKTARVGIICFTEENKSRPWLYVESGVIAYKYYTEIENLKLKLLPLLLNISDADFPDYPFVRINKFLFNDKDDISQAVADIFHQINQSRDTKQDKDDLDNNIRSKLSGGARLIEEINKLKTKRKSLVDSGVKPVASVSEAGGKVSVNDHQCFDDEKIENSVRVLKLIKGWLTEQGSIIKVICSGRSCISYEVVINALSKDLNMGDEAVKSILYFLKEEGCILLSSRRDLHGSIHKFLSLTTKADAVLLDNFDLE